MRLGCILLHWEKADPADLVRLIASVRSQHGEPIEILVVSQGVEAPELPEGVHTVELPENLGIIGGRNAGLEAFRERFDVDAILFLDSDGRLGGDEVARTVRARFAEDPRLGIVSFRIVDPDSGVTQRRHVPRVRVGDPARSSEVTTFLGGASAIRIALLDEVGELYPEQFYYGHEETDLAWRALDAGWRIRYDADCVLFHPLTLPTKHPTYFRMNARNRVWLARRYLPWPLAIGYLGTWVLLTLARTRTLAGLRMWWSGFREGLRTPAGRRRPMRWRTIGRMTRLGRPPLI